MKHLVKRAGHEEDFDARKLYASVYAACFSIEMDVAACEQIAEKVTRYVEKSIADQEHVTSHQLFKLAGHELQKYNPDAAYLYKTHRDIS